MNNMKIYLASPFFNNEEKHEIDIVKQVEKILKSKGLTVFSPRLNQMDHLEPGTRQWSIETFTNDKKFIDWAEVIVGVYHGNYSDSGTAWELGYAYGTNKPIIVVHVGNDSNLMVHEGAHANITLSELEDYDFEKMPSSFYDGDMF